MRALVLVILMLASAPAATADSAPHWLQVRTGHFVVLTDSNEKQARKLAIQFERMRTVFLKLLPNSNADDGAEPITVLALKDKKGFQSLEPAAYLAKDQLDLSGYFLSNQDKNYILLRLDEEGQEHPFSSIYHEYTHYMVRKVEWLPLWMNEGMAEFYQNTDIYDKEVLLGQPSEDDILFLRQNSLIPLSTLLAVDHTSPYYHDEQKGSIFYAESWALMHFIMVTDNQNRASRFSDYANYLGHGEDSVAAAQHAFGDLKQLQKDLQSYVQQGSFKEFRLPFAAAIDDSKFQVQPISVVDANVIRADVLIENGRTKDGLALLETVMHDDPKNAIARETMGALKMREDDQPAAKKWYGEAVQMGSHSYLAHYYYAALTMQAGGNDEDAAIEAGFHEAIKLNPGFAPAYDALSVFYNNHHEKLDEGSTLSARAVQLEPENLNYRLNEALILSQQQSFDAALDILRGAERIARDPGNLAILDGRIREIERYQASVKRASDENAAIQRARDAGGIVKTTTTTTNGVTTTTTTVTMNGDDGSNPARDEPKYPEGPPTGPHHTARGVIRSAHCSYPTILTLNLEQPGKTISLYSNNLNKIVFVILTPNGAVNPCKNIDGAKAKIEYGEVIDKTVAGQIISIELSK